VWGAKAAPSVSPERIVVPQVTSAVMLLDLKNTGIAVEILLLSRIVALLRCVIFRPNISIHALLIRHNPVDFCVLKL